MGCRGPVGRSGGGPEAAWLCSSLDASRGHGWNPNAQVWVLQRPVRSAHPGGPLFLMEAGLHPTAASGTEQAAAEHGPHGENTGHAGGDSGLLAEVTGVLLASSLGTPYSNSSRAMRMLRVQGLRGLSDWTGWTLAPAPGLLTGSVPLGSSLYLSEPQFPPSSPWLLPPVRRGAQRPLAVP